MNYMIIVVPVLFGFVLPMSIVSCTTNYEQYHADWIVSKLEIEGENRMGDVFLYNVNIDLDMSVGMFPGLWVGIFDEKGAVDCKVSVHEKDGLHYLEVSDHHIFNGVYELKCLDEQCCTLTMRSDRIYMEMDYNMDIPFGITRPCKPAVLPGETIESPLRKKEPNG